MAGPAAVCQWVLCEALHFKLNSTLGFFPGESLSRVCVNVSVLFTESLCATCLNM